MRPERERREPRARDGEGALVLEHKNVFRTKIRTPYATPMEQQQCSAGDSEDVAGRRVVAHAVGCPSDRVRTVGCFFCSEHATTRTQLAIATHCRRRQAEQTFARDVQADKCASLKVSSNI